MLVTMVFVVRPGFTGHHDADFPQLIEGTANRPYVARALVPVTIRYAVRALPDGVKAYADEQLRGRRMLAQLQWNGAYYLEYVLACGVAVVAFLGFAWVMRSLVVAFFPGPRALIDFAPVLALTWLPLFFRYYSYPYDPVTLLLFAFGLLLIVRGRFPALVAVMALASLNKETAILLAVVYVVHARTTRGNFAVGRAAILVAVWLAIRLAFGRIYADNPGTLVEPHFVDHNVWFFTRFPWAMRYTLVVVAFFVALLVPGWRAKPPFLRWGLVATLLPLVAAATLFGFVDELRSYYEAYPFLFLLSFSTLARE